MSMQPPDMNQLMQQAAQMQAQLAAQQEAASDTTVEGQAGGGMVKVQVSGLMEFQSVTIDPQVVDPEDVEMLQDLVLAALRDASDRVQKLNEEALGGLGALKGMFG